MLINFITEGNSRIGINPESVAVIRELTDSLTGIITHSGITHTVQGSFDEVFSKFSPPM